jgi:hypothetical protein
VRASPGPSAIHGLGLIAREPIRADAKVWEFRPGFDLVLSHDLVDSLAAASREQVRHYGFSHLASGMILLSVDDDRFTNHSNNPNTRIVGCSAVAVREIAVGEEITADYRELGHLALLVDDERCGIR